MKFILSALIVISCSSLYAEDPFCKGKGCSEFDQYVSQIKETYLRMQKLNDSCQKQDGKSCADLAALVRDSELTIKPEFKENNKKFLGKLGIDSDPKVYEKKACDYHVCSK